MPKIRTKIPNKELYALTKATIKTYKPYLVKVK